MIITNLHSTYPRKLSDRRKEYHEVFYAIYGPLMSSFCYKMIYKPISILKMGNERHGGCGNASQITGA